MINLSKKSIIYIVIPARVATGGPEALHQLGDAINRQGGKAKAVYINSENKIVKNGKLFRYKKYRIRPAKEIIDNSLNVIVFPELYVSFGSHLEHIQRCIWWLSVNYGVQNKINFESEGIFHLAQSHYALDYLKNQKAKNIYPLFDYLAIKKLNRKKEDYITYNPTKGIKTTEQLINKLPDFRFVPLRNLSVQQLSATLAKSKIYIDFGDHPGKDRIPREAALNGNIVITGKKGSANYFEDVPIKDTFKITDSDIESICNQIQFSMANYQQEINLFRYYQRVILSQKKEFFIQVQRLFVFSHKISITKCTFFFFQDLIFNHQTVSFIENLWYKVKKNIPNRIISANRR